MIITGTKYKSSHLLWVPHLTFKAVTLLSSAIHTGTAIPLIKIITSNETGVNRK